MPFAPESQHGPTFPYRFSFDISANFYGQKPRDVPLGSHFCRWTLDHPARALEFNDEGKGKGVTILPLPNDGPARCCSERTPQLFIEKRIDQTLESLLPGPGRMYCAFISGHGWYSADPGTDYFIRLVTKKEDVPRLREEALMYEQEPPGIRREPLRPKSQNANEPVAFHGFFQTDARDAAAIILEFRVLTPACDGKGDKLEELGTCEKPRKKKGKKRRRNTPTP